MALVLLENASEKTRAQRELERSLKRVLRKQGIRNIGYPGGNSNHMLYSNGAGQLWFAPALPEDNRIPRYWNSFGVFHPNAGAQTITLEINIPVESNSAQVAGFFARDTTTGEILLMHSGKVAGGRPGIGKSAFLAWSKPTLHDVTTSNDRYRSAFVVSPLNAVDLIDRIWALVVRVAEFKSLAASGALSTSEFRHQVTVYQKYSKGFSGRKHGKRRSEIDYFTFHDDVVDSLAAARVTRLAKGERDIKTGLIDFGITVGDDLVELYEVKTSCDRQSLYTALGQLVTHSCGASVGIKRFLVLPAADPIPSDISAAIKNLGISVRNFTAERRGQKTIVSVSL